MGTIAEELTTLANNKANIKSAIEAKNPTVPPTNDLSQWPTSIQSIETPVLQDMGTVLANRNSDGSDASVTYAKDIYPSAGYNGISHVKFSYRANNITITPTTQQQIKQHTAAQVSSLGYVGYKKVTVNPVTASIDANIVAGNIKKDVSILGVTGTYEGSGGGGSNHLMILSGSGVSHDGTQVNGNIWKDVTTVSFDCGSRSYIVVSAQLDDGTSINGNFESYDVTLNGRSMLITYTYQACLLKGTSIFLSDGTKKPIEDVTYNDDLLVWDFDEGKFSSSKPIWIKKAETTNYYFVNKYRSGKVLLTTGQSSTGWGHRTFDMNKNRFIYTTESVSDGIFTLDGIDTHMSCARVDEPCEFYNIITERHFNLFANGILTSCSLNNLYPIQDMKYVKDDRELRDISDYDNIPQEWFEGLRLAENQVNPTKINQYVKNLLETGVK